MNFGFKAFFTLVASILGGAFIGSVVLALFHPSKSWIYNNGFFVSAATGLIVGIVIVVRYQFLPLVRAMRAEAAKTPVENGAARNIEWKK